MKMKEETLAKIMLVKACILLVAMFVIPIACLPKRECTRVYAKALAVEKVHRTFTITNEVETWKRVTVKWGNNTYRVMLPNHHPVKKGDYVDVCL